MSSSGERRPARGSRWKRAAVLGGAVLWLALAAAPASAHAVLVDSRPAAGSRLGAAPGTVQLRFSEDLAPRFRSATLVDGQGSPVGGTSVAGGGRRLLTTRLPSSLPDGAYGVLWQVLSETDGHTTRGVVVFNVGAGGGPAPGPAEVGEAAARPSDVARRWVEVSLLAGLVGALAVAGAVLGRAGAGRPAEPLGSAIRAARRRLLTFAAACAAAAATAQLADVAAEASRQAPGAADGAVATAVALLTGTRWGQVWLAREAALLGLLALALGLRSRVDRPPGPGRRARAAGSAVLVAVLVTAEAMGSHAAALDSGRPAAVAAAALHILTACLWLGMLPALGLMLWPQRGVGGGLADLLMASRGPLTGLAAGSVALLVVTGLYSAGREVEAVDGLWRTPYGRALLAKSALLLVVGTLGLVNAARLHGWYPRWLGLPGRRGLIPWPSRRLVAIEAAAGALLLAAVGVLVESAPARSPAPVPAVAAAPASEAVSGSVDDLVVTLSVTPNRPGVNGFTVLAASSRRPPPAEVDRVSLELAGAGDTGAVALRQVAPGRWFGTARLERSGPLRLRALLRRAGARMTVPLSSWVGSPVPVPDRTAGPAPGRRLAPLVDGLAAAITAATAAGAAWLVRRRRRVQLVQPTRVQERALEGAP